MVNSEFACGLAERGNCNLLTNLVSNKHKAQECIDSSNARHIINGTGLLKINLYSTVIPRYFDQVILTNPGYRFTFSTLEESLERTLVPSNKANGRVRRESNIHVEYREARSKLEAETRYGNSHRSEVTGAILSMDQLCKELNHLLWVVTYILWTVRISSSIWYHALTICLIWDVVKSSLANL